jgi:transposase-like protein
MYSKGKNSYRMIGDILKIDHTLVYRWIKKYAASIEEPKVSETVEEIEFDEMWHYIGSKKQNLADKGD